MSLEKAGKYACYEYERRFLLKSLPAGLHNSNDFKDIEDTYFAGARLRLRIIRDPSGKVLESKLTQKYFPDQNPNKAVITNLYLSETEVQILSEIKGHKIHKRRYKFVDPIGSFAVDHFESNNLVIAEIEFDTEEQMIAFSLPFSDWKELRDLAPIAALHGKK